MNRAIFLDRDGTINEEVVHPEPNQFAPRHPDEFKLISKVGSAIKLLNDAGLKVVVVTNQAGVARGYFTEEMVIKIHQQMKRDLSKAGAFLDAVYYCPHHPDAGCYCRKPKPGMLEQAAHDLDIDLKRSYVIGDKMTDLIPGTNVGCKTILVLTGRGKYLKMKENIDYIASDLYGAAKWILGDIEGE
jgi:D-glycero-D-manno-heptose 1,7-bisphosphate phosphatase